MKGTPLFDMVWRKLLPKKSVKSTYCVWKNGYTTTFKLLRLASEWCSNQHSRYGSWEKYRWDRRSRSFHVDQQTPARRWPATNSKILKSSSPISHLATQFQFITNIFTLPARAFESESRLLIYQPRQQFGFISSSPHCTYSSTQNDPSSSKRPPVLKLTSLAPCDLISWWRRLFSWE